MTDPTVNRQPALDERPRSRVRQFLANWQEMIFWLPGLAILTVLGAVFLGAFPGVETMADTIAMLGELPAFCCYAAAASAFTWLFMRTNVFLKRRSDLDAVFRDAVDGNREAAATLAVYLLMWLCVLVAFLWFFRPAR